MLNFKGRRLEKTKITRSNSLLRALYLNLEDFSLNWVNLMDKKKKEKKRKKKRKERERETDRQREREREKN